MLHNRFSPIVETLDYESQCSFRPGRRCVDGTFTVKLTIRDDLGALLFLFFLAAVMISWRTDHPREVCIFHTKFIIF